MATVARDSDLVDRGIEAVGARYTLVDPSAVTSFLRDRPGVVTTLIEAVEVIPRYFGPGPVVALEVVSDPEAHGDVELYARIRTDIDVDAALDRLRRFDQEWWLDALPRAQYALTFTIEYV